MKKYYATKWVLTRGIVEIEGEVRQYGKGSQRNAQIEATEIPPGVRCDELLKLNVNVFETVEEAQKDAKRRARKNFEERVRAAERAEGLYNRFLDESVPVRYLEGS